VKEVASLTSMEIPTDPTASTVQLTTLLRASTLLILGGPEMAVLSMDAIYLTQLQVAALLLTTVAGTLMTPMAIITTLKWSQLTLQTLFLTTQSQ
jgi:hypothetical protein